MNEMLNVREFATMMRLSTVSVYRLIEQGAIPHYRVGRNIRIRIDDFRKENEEYEEFQILEDD